MSTVYIPHARHGVVFKQAASSAAVNMPRARRSVIVPPIVIVAVAYAITTEAGDTLTTEAGDTLTTEA